MFCREQVAQLRDVTPQFLAKPLRLAVVGNGSVAQAAAFAAELEISFELYTDPRLGSYKAAGLVRSIGSVLSLGGVKNAFRALSRGHHQSMVRGDAWQQGGAFVIAPGNRLLYAQRSRTGGDHVDPQELLSALGS